MTTDISTVEHRRITRFLENRLGDHTWRIDEAKAKLTKIMKEAVSGRPQLVGIQKPVVMVGLKELEELVLSLREPETWGEYFSTHYDDAEDNLDLTSPSRPGIASYALDTDHSEDAATEIPNEIVDDLKLVQAYLDMGDADAASALIELTSDRQTTKTASFGNWRFGIEQAVVVKGVRKKNIGRLKTFIAKHPIGSKVDCRVVTTKDKRIILVVGDKLPAIAFTRDAQEKRFKSGSHIRAVIVNRLPKEVGLAVSLHDSSTGEILADACAPKLQKKTQ